LRIEGDGSVVRQIGILEAGKIEEYNKASPYDVVFDSQGTLMAVACRWSRINTYCYQIIVWKTQMGTNGLALEPLWEGTLSYSDACGRPRCTFIGGDRLAVWYSSPRGIDLRHYHAYTGAQILNREIDLTSYPNCGAVSINAQGTIVAFFVGSDLYILDANSGAELSRWHLQQKFSHLYDDRERFYSPPAEPTCGPVFSPAGSMVAVGTCYGGVFVLDVSRKASRMFKGHYSDVLHLVFSPDGALLLSWAKDGSAALWSVP
jgi:hypothetical protein